MWEFDSLIPNHRSSKVAADFFSGCSAVGSALGSGPRGRGFESRHSDHKKLFHRLVKELFVFHGVTGFEPTASPQRDTSSPVDCLRGCGRIRARLPHRALWTVPRQNSPRKNSQRANQQSHSRIFLKIFPALLQKSAKSIFSPWQRSLYFTINKFSSGFYLGMPHSIVSKQTVYPSSSTKSLSMIFLMIFFAFSNALSKIPFSIALSSIASWLTESKFRTSSTLTGLNSPSF